MNGKPPNERSDGYVQESGPKAASLLPAPALHENTYLDQALQQARIMFWVSVTAGSAATILQLCMIVCFFTQSHSENQLAAKVLLSLSFNTVSVVAYRQAKEIRQWSTNMLFKTQLIHLAALVSRRQSASGLPLPPVEWILRLQTLSADWESDGVNKTDRGLTKDGSA